MRYKFFLILIGKKSNHELRYILFSSDKRSESFHGERCAWGFRIGLEYSLLECAYSGRWTSVGQQPVCAWRVRALGEL